MTPDRLSFLFLHDAASFCETIAMEAVRSGDEVTMVLPSPGLTTYPQLAKRTIISNRGRSKVTTYARALAKADYDVVVASSRLAWVMGAIMRRRGSKLVPVLMGSDIRRLRTVVASKRGILERALKSSDFVFYTDPDTKEVTSALGVPFGFLPVPIDTELFSPQGDAEALQGSPAVFVPTRLDADKGTGTISKVISLILGEYEDARIYMVKWAKAKATLEAVAGELDSDRVKLLDFLRRREMPRYYRGASVLIGQMQLGFGSMTEWEAVGCGLPPVYYDVYDGYGVGKRDPRELLAYFDSLVSDEGFRREKVRKGLELVKNIHASGRVFEAFRSRVKELFG